MNYLVRKGATAMVAAEKPMSKEVGSALVGTGVGGLIVMGLAGLIPFVTFPMLLVLMVIAGGYLYVK